MLYKHTINVHLGERIKDTHKLRNSLKQYFAESRKIPEHTFVTLDKLFNFPSYGLNWKSEDNNINLKSSCNFFIGKKKKVHVKCYTKFGTQSSRTLPYYCYYCGFIELLLY